ncbi:unnamed protein product [Linum trigynum]|uniref:Uncharacterized protein n=1 Tax=Linum trigynum TaxID=586398 RepID=A0AAV2ETR4_9ROSI
MENSSEEDLDEDENNKLLVSVRSNKEDGRWLLSNHYELLSSNEDMQLCSKTGRRNEEEEEEGRKSRAK